MSKVRTFFALAGHFSGCSSKSVDYLWPNNLFHSYHAIDGWDRVRLHSILIGLNTLQENSQKTENRNCEKETGEALQLSVESHPHKSAK